MPWGVIEVPGDFETRESGNGIEEGGGNSFVCSKLGIAFTVAK